jgi:hypothetical protein
VLLRGTGIRSWQLSNIGTDGAMPVIPDRVLFLCKSCREKDCRNLNDGQAGFNQDGRILYQDTT